MTNFWQLWRETLPGINQFHHAEGEWKNVPASFEPLPVGIFGVLGALALLSSFCASSTGASSMGAASLGFLGFSSFGGFDPDPEVFGSFTDFGSFVPLDEPEPDVLGTFGSLAGFEPEPEPEVLGSLIGLGVFVPFDEFEPEVLGCLTGLGLVSAGFGIAVIGPIGEFGSEKC